MKKGYHDTPIKKGKFGDFSKINEEIQELLDAHNSDIKVMELAEFADLLSAINQYLKTKYSSIDIFDIIKMAERTERAFKSGHRK